MNPTINRMIAPSQKRPSVYSGGTIQIMVTRACDLSCCHCTQGSNLAGKPVVMSVDQFDEACRSLEGYWGMVGMFGGNPCVHPQFAKLCEVMRSTIPYRQRGLWSNNLMGKGAHARVTFNPKYSNLNMHLNKEAGDEVRRDWPEAAAYVKGEDTGSMHSSPWVSMKDLAIAEEERWKLIGDCDINKYWSAMICIVRGRLRAFFCEVAGAQAMLHEKNPDWAGTGKMMPETGLAVEPGWWRRPMADYAAQVSEHCHHCGIPMRREGRDAESGAPLEYTKTHEFISWHKRAEVGVELVEIGDIAPRPDRPATEYLPGTTPAYRQTCPG